MKMHLLKGSLILLLTFCFIDVFSQYALYESGEITFTSGEVKAGQVWPGAPSHKNQKVFFKHTKGSLPEEYSPAEVVSFTYGKDIEFASIIIPTETGPVGKFGELVYSGTRQLITYNDGQKSIFFVKDSVGDIFELTNTYELPSNKNNFVVTYNREYRETLKEIFKTRTNLHPLIDNSQLNSTDIANILSSADGGKPIKIQPAKATRITPQKYKRSRNSISIPLKPFQLYIGAEAGVSPIVYNILGDESSTTLQYLPSAGVNFGIVSVDKLFDLAFEMHLLKGALLHDGEAPFSGGTIFLDDRTDGIISNIGINLKVSPFKSLKISPYLSAGIQIYGYLDFNRIAIEEYLYTVSQIVITEIDEDFSKPESSLNFVLKGGGSYSLTEKSDLKINLTWSVPGAKNLGIRSINGISFSYLYYFSKNEK
jgi:hypothetical protein